MRPYTITIEWRGFGWKLTARANCSMDLVEAMLEYFPGGALVSVRPVPPPIVWLDPDEANKREKIARYEGRRASPMETDIFGRLLRW